MGVVVGMATVFADIHLGQTSIFIFWRMMGRGGGC